MNENAFELLAFWKQRAKKLGKSPEEIKRVLDLAKSGDYKHLKQVLKDNCDCLTCNNPLNIPTI